MSDAANAAAIAGQTAEAISWRDRSRALVAKVSDPAEREMFEGDLETLPV